MRSLMAGKFAHVTFRQIAKASGLAVATVSYALRNHPKIPAETIARVQAVADALGYRPNPRVAALMAHIRRARPVASGDCIAFIWLARPAPYLRMYNGAKQRAQELGYELEDFALRDRALNPARLERILRARRITGIVLSPLDSGQASFALDWDWSRFSPAICTPARTASRTRSIVTDLLAATNRTVFSSRPASRIALRIRSDTASRRR